MMHRVEKTVRSPRSHNRRQMDWTRQFSTWDLLDRSDLLTSSKNLMRATWVFSSSLLNMNALRATLDASDVYRVYLRNQSTNGSCHVTASSPRNFSCKLPNFEAASHQIELSVTLSAVNGAKKGLLRWHHVSAMEAEWIPARNSQSIGKKLPPMLFSKFI